MATITLLEKARQRRLNALAARGMQPAQRHEDNVVSIFDFAFDEAPARAAGGRSNVIAFRSRNRSSAPLQIAA